MRLKLEPTALPVDNHAAAASLRDNTGVAAIKQQEFSLPITPAVVRRRDGEDEEDGPIVEEEELARLTAEAQIAADQSKDESFAASNTTGGTREAKVVISQECEMITLMSRIRGKFDVTTTHLVFHDLSPLRDDRPRQDHRWSLHSLREIHLRKYNLRRSALEIFLLDQTNYFFNFSTKTRNKVFSRILSLQPPNILYGSGRSPSELLRASGLTQRWQRREISNFDYLMHLNTIAGRTYNDLSQYPVFPWVLTDYHSEELDLENPDTFRDLSKPIGVVNPKNEAEVRAKYDSFEDPTGTISKFHYGTHYSNSAGVLHYLIRVEPFTSLHIELQSGRFDVADRQFHSIPQTWKLLMDNPNDVKELTPEFYYFPEFLRNVNNLDLGKLQVTKEQVSDVILPPWARDAEDFINLHRRALESEHVSNHLHEWIDLIFGCKQKGSKAAKALNVFYYCSYEGAVDLDAIRNPKEREAVEGMINNFGQTPSQLMRESHPKRMSKDEAAKRLLRGELKRPDMTTFLSLATLFTCLDAASDKDPIIYLSSPRSPPRSFLQTGPDCVVSVSKFGVLGTHNWQSSDRSNPRGFLFEPDASINLPKARKRLPGPFHPSYTPDSRTFSASLDGRVIYCGGLWDGSIRAYSVARGRLLQTAIRHMDVVTCLSIDSRRGAFLLSGSRDCTCAVWEVLPWAGGATNGPLLNPIRVLRGHDAPVTCVALHGELDVAISGSEDGTVNVYALRSGRYVRTLRPKGCEIARAPDAYRSFLPRVLDNSIVIEYTEMSSQGHAVFAARDRCGCSLHVFTVNGTWVGSKRVSGRMTGLATAGDNVVCVDDAGDLTMSRLQGLKPVFDIPLHVPIQGVCVAPGNTHVLCPLRDGRLAVLGPPVPQQKGSSSKSIHHV